MLKSVEKFLSKMMGGTNIEREIKRITPMVADINEIAASYEQLTDDEIKAKTNEFKFRLRMGETLDDILPEAFAVVKDTCRRLRGKKWMVRGQEVEWDMVPYDVQILGGVVLHDGRIAEMATGEGKTLVATMPLYLNALEGKGAHLITVNDYLAQRDCEWMGKIYEFLGLTVSAIFGDQSPEERRSAYQADITYGTNNEFGFDYLRDNMAQDVWNVVQRPLHYAIIDEVDSVLIDEARTPLIISGAVGAPKNVYKELKPTVENLVKRQGELVNVLLRDGMQLLENNEEQAGIKILQVHRGDPKNKQLLELLTSEFWVKKLIERIQGQYEVNKAMAEIDADLYYTIDEKSHIIDITEKGRIFLSGGRDQDIVNKIQKLDELDAILEKLSSSKKRSDYFTRDSITGLCNGMTLAGFSALLGIQTPVSEKDLEPMEQLSAALALVEQEVSARQSGKKTDKATVWRQFYEMAKKADSTVNGLTAEGKSFLVQSANGYDENVVNALEKLYNIIREEADVDGPSAVGRVVQDRRRNLETTFFQVDKQTGCPTGLTVSGKLGVLAVLKSGDPLLVPMINSLQALLQPAKGQNTTEALNAIQDFFEFKDNGAVLQHITEKGRIALLGGNPDLYVLPDRSLVEERDQQIQRLLDDSLNQADYDYTEKVMAVESMEHTVIELYQYINQNNNESDFYQPDPGRNRVTITPLAEACLSQFSGESIDVVSLLDAHLATRQYTDNDILQISENGTVTGLTDAEKDRLLGASFQQVAESLRSSAGNVNNLAGRLQLDADILAKFKFDNSVISPTLRFEQVGLLSETIKHIFANLTDPEQTPVEKLRWLRRYFIYEGNVTPEQPVLDSVKLTGLSENGRSNLVGLNQERHLVAQTLAEAAMNIDIEIEALFNTDEKGYPQALEKSARTLLVDGLPFFSYQQEFQNFRDEVMQLSTKKVNTRNELQALLPKEKAQLYSHGIVLDDREITELLSNAHMPNFVMRNEEVEHWFRIHFERKPRLVLEHQRDKIWQDYNRVEERVQNISQLLRAYTLYHRDVEYVVKAVEEGEMRRSGGMRGKKAVMIVDQFTGRLMPGRRFSEGLHEALEAKEGVEVQAESQTLATITLQNFFRIYNKLAGMTGTAETESQEFFSTYELDVIVIPTNKPVVRDDRNDVIYRTKQEKYNAIIQEAIDMHENGLPVLIGTVSVDVSQHLSQIFTQYGIPVANWLKKGDVSKELESGRFHTVLNAKYHKNEAEIVAKAGLPGAITIATNMAGRGTDIKLTPEVIEKGGLQIIGSEKHEARRIDRQLRGRSGRQGDPGMSRFYLSLEDDLMRLFGADRITNIMSRLGSMEEGERIEHPMITRSIENAQKKVEERNYEIRKHLLEYDDVLNEQRKIIYKRRQNLLGFAEAGDFVESKIKRYIGEEDDRTTWKLQELMDNLHQYFGITPDFTVEEMERQEIGGLRELLGDWVSEQLTEQRHLYQMQERHRIFGYVDVKQVVAELVTLKIRLHNAGTDDVSRWNMDGIAYELDRIFKEKPTELLENPASTAAEMESRLQSWATDLFERQWQEHQEVIDRLWLRGLTQKEFIDHYMNGLVNKYLPIDVSSATWNTEALMNDLEKVFMQRPSFGENEMRTYSRERAIEKIAEWLKELFISKDDDLLYRNRILGYFSTQHMIEAIVENSFVQYPDLQGNKDLELVPEQKYHLEKLFGASFETESKPEDRNQLVYETVKWAFNTYMAYLRTNMPVYNTALIANASIEEIIEATIILKYNQIMDMKKDTDTTRALLSISLNNMFLGKPDNLLISGDSDDQDHVYAEDLVSWGLSFYKTYSDRIERLHQERLSSEIVNDSVLSMIDDTIFLMISDVLDNADDLDENQLRRLESECRLVFRQSPRLRDESKELQNPNSVLDTLSSWAHDIYRRRVNEIGEQIVVRNERYYILEKIDENWRQHLGAIDELREGIGLRGYGQKDPLLEYKSEAYKMFVKMIDSTNRDVVSILFRVLDVGGEQEERNMRRREPQQLSTSHSQVDVFKQVMAPQKQAAKPQPGAPAGKPKQVVNVSKVGRNDPCPCGSGKKYKNCCGKNA